ncbi:MAG: hypothetical protein Q7S66_00440 [bacterium]|nr:hypothetical protein [bacterium]
MRRIIPTVLATDFKTFSDQLQKLSELADLLQIDVMDGKFVPDKSYQDIEVIKTLPIKTDWELHLMVQNPLEEMAKWTGFKNIRRAIFHIESADDPNQCIDFANKQGWTAGIAINPETPLTAVEPYYGRIEEVMFLCIVPGRQGNKFLPEVMDKIKEFVKLETRPFCAVDGSVNKDTIGQLSKIGVEIFGVGSAFTRAPDAQQAYDELLNLI